MAAPPATLAALAAHRFGLGEASLDGSLRGDPRAWLVGQIGAADVQRGVGTDTLPSAADGLRRFAEFVRQRRERLAHEVKLGKPSRGIQRSAGRGR